MWCSRTGFFKIFPLMFLCTLKKKKKSYRFFPLEYFVLYWRGVIVIICYIGEFQWKSHVSSRRAIYVVATITIIDLLFFFSNNCSKVTTAQFLRELGGKNRRQRERKEWKYHILRSRLKWDFEKKEFIWKLSGGKEVGCSYFGLLEATQT